ncbi:MAG: four helix bundle protein, partial [Anaerolineae bacterium]|nr:four helix bundle protein [Anaerolineae bacterium]
IAISSTWSVGKWDWRIASSEWAEGQLRRSGTAPAAQYAEARGAECTKDFPGKLRLCLRELNESRV